MERSNFWTFLGLGLALGICLEVMKHPAAKTNVRLAGFTRFETLLAEGRQVYIADEPKPESKKRAKEEEKIVPHQLTPEEMPPTEAFAPPPPPPANPAPKVETPEEKKKREEAEKKKKRREKKKALKEKLRKEEEERKAKAAGEKKDESEDDKKKEDDGAEANPAMGTITKIIKLPENGSEDDPKTVAEWEAYLMKDVDHSRLNRFVRAYQTGQISPETFYTVVGDMLQDHRPEIHSLAIMALGATPSQTSFDMLISVSSENPHSSARSQALGYLDTYARLENLRFLMGVITGSRNPTAVVQAIRLVQLSAKNASKSRTGQPSAQNVRAANVNLTRFYQPFVPVLTAASQNGQQTANVRSAARSALQDLQSLLGQLQSQQSPLNGGGTQTGGTTPPATRL